MGDGAPSGELKAPGTGYFKPSHTLSFVSITFDKCRYRLPKFDAAVDGFSRAVVS